MYLSDLLDALDNGKPIELSRRELIEIFQKQKPLNDSQRLALFHRLGLRYRDREWPFEKERLTQKEVAEKTGVSLELVKQYDAGNLSV